MNPCAAERVHHSLLKGPGVHRLMFQVLKLLLFKNNKGEARLTASSARGLRVAWLLFLQASSFPAVHPSPHLGHAAVSLFREVWQKPPGEQLFPFPFPHKHVSISPPIAFLPTAFLESEALLKDHRPRGPKRS